MMLQNLPDLFENLGPGPFSALLVYLGVAIGVALACLLWLRHLLRFNRIQSQKRELSPGFDQALAEEKSLQDQIELIENEFNWDSVDGITPGVATQLKKLGIRDVEHLVSLSPAERESFKSKLTSEGQPWDWSWLANWKTGAAATAATAAGIAGVASKSDQKTDSDKTGQSAQTSGAQKSGFIAGSRPGMASDRPAPHDLNLVSNDAPKVDWSSVNGVSPELAAEFGNMGIKNVEQLESLSPADRKRLELRLQSKRLSWNWDWLSSWKTGAAATAATAAGIAGVASKPDQKTDFVKTDFDKTDFDKTDFDKTQQSAQTSDSKNSGFNGGSLPGWPSDRPASHELKFASNDASKTDWSTVDGVSPELAAEFDNMGIKSVEQLESLSPADREKLESRLKSKGLSWNWDWLSSWKTGLAGMAGLGAAAVGAIGLDSQKTKEQQQPESDKANLSDVKHEFGTKPVKGFAAGAGLSGDRSATDAEKNNSADQASHAAAETNLQSSSGSTSSHPQSGETQKSSNPSAASTPASALTLGGAKPEFKDDLTLLDGIDGPQAAELQKMGIFNFTQLHNLGLEDRAKLQNLFRQRGWRLDMDQWRIASDGNTEHPSIEDIQRKAFEVYQDRDRKGFGGGERTDWEQAEWELRGNPIFSYGVPHEVDDFAVSLAGVTPEARDELYRMGLYNQHQLKHLGSDARRLLTRWFAGPRFGVDLTQSFGWLSSMDSVPTDKDFGLVFATRPSRVDDLSDVNGIGGPTEHDLNRIGIYQFEQIANWTAENISAFNDLLGLDGRIDSDQWVVQARRLVKNRW